MNYVLHYNGTGWEPIDGYDATVAGTALSGLAGTSDLGAWAVGTQLLLHLHQ